MLNKKLNYIFYLEVLILFGFIYSIAITPLLLLSYELLKDNLEFKIFIPLIYLDDIFFTIWLTYRIFIKIENRYNLLGWYLDIRKYDLAIEGSNELGFLLYLYSYILIFIPYVYILLVDFHNKEELFNDSIFQMYIYYKIGFYSLYNLSVALCILFVLLVFIYRCCCYKCLINNKLIKSNKVYDVTYTKRTIKSSRMFSV